MDIQDYIYNTKIIKLESPKYNQIKNSFIDEKFIEIKESERIKLDLQYTKLKFKNAINKAYIREGTYTLLLKALEFLPNEYGFKILDVWRPYKLQKELYDSYSKQIIHDFKIENYSEKEKNLFISKFIAYPNDDIELPPMHTTGGAIDLILTDKDGNELDLGVKFDEFSEKAYSSYYEDKLGNDMIKMNRRILYNTMTLAGFSNLPSEIWHYDYGNKNWAYYTKNASLYKGIFEQ